MCGKGLCISTGKHVLWGAGAVLWGSWLFPGNLGALWTAIRAKQPCHGGQPGRRGWSCSPQLGMELLTTELGTPARAFLSRVLFWQRNLGRDCRSHNWDLSLSLPVPWWTPGFCTESCRLDSLFLISPCWHKGPLSVGTMQEQKPGTRAASPAAALLWLPSCLPGNFQLRVGVKQTQSGKVMVLGILQHGVKRPRGA